MPDCIVGEFGLEVLIVRSGLSCPVVRNLVKAEFSFTISPSRKPTHLLSIKTIKQINENLRFIRSYSLQKCYVQRIEVKDHRND